MVPHSSPEARRTIPGTTSIPPRKLVASANAETSTFPHYGNICRPGRLPAIRAAR
jgi:hypothetical protein